MLENANIFVTGGAGTLGKAIARRRKRDGWTGKLTVYSTDEHKHAILRKDHPDINFVCGDIRNPETLYNAMVGHDIVIHAAAVKVIPVSEVCSIDTIDVNVLGSQVVCQTALRAQIQHVLGISTDKACHPANAYGASKMLMEKIFQEYARMGFDTQFHLVRYGNVLESTGSVIEAWKQSIERGEPIRMTDPEMTRFWLSPSQAVQYVLDALECDSGLIYIPKMPALSIGDLADYTVNYNGSCAMTKFPIERIPLRPGEKMHETLLTSEEGYYAIGSDNLFLPPTTGKRKAVGFPAYSSDIARRLTQPELIRLLADETMDESIKYHPDEVLDPRD